MGLTSGAAGGGKGKISNKGMAIPNKNITN